MNKQMGFFFKAVMNKQGFFYQMQPVAIFKDNFQKILTIFQVQLEPNKDNSLGNVQF